MNGCDLKAYLVSRLEIVAKSGAMEGGEVMGPLQLRSHMLADCGSMP